LLHYLHEFVGTIDTVLSLRHTVEPLLSSHPLGNGRIGALRIFFYHQVKSFELWQENHNKHVFQCFYQASLSVTEFYLLLPFLK